ncbi:MAG: FAD-dependent oxidoreductase [Pseudomonadota bacterium]
MSGRAVVIGAGITGVAAALWLQRAGWSATLIDRVPPGDPAQTSFGNAGLLARASVVPVSTPGLIWRAPRMLLDPDAPLFLRWRYLPRLIPWLVPFLRNGSRRRVEKIAQALVRMTGDAVDQHKALARDTPAERLIRQGEYIYLYASRKAAKKDSFGMALRQAYGFAPEERDAEALRAADPALGPGARYGLALPDHGWITDPGGYVGALAASFRDRGGTMRQAEIADIAPGRAVLAGGETIAADRIILTSGVWSRILAERLGMRMPLESERGYHLMLRSPSLLPPTPYMIADSSFVATPMAAGMRLAGILEFGGTTAPASSAPFDLLRRAIRRVYPGLSWQAEERWMGHRPSLPDSLPVLGIHPRHPGIVHAYGGQHVGLTIGPRLGRLAAALASEGRVNEDLAAFAPDRFSG